MLTFTDDQVKHIFEAVKWFESDFRSFFLRILSDQIPRFQKTSELSEMSDHLDQLLKDFADPQTDHTVNLDGVALSCLKRALLDYRRSMAKQFEWYKARTIHPEVIHTLEMHVSPLDKLLEQDWIREVKPAKKPRLTEYIPVEQAERIRLQEKIISLHAVSQHLGMAFNPAAMANTLTSPTDNQYEPPEREYDEKFHILQSPGLFLEDLAEVKYSGVPERTTVSIGVCYIDPDCSLTNREAMERANDAKRFAKDQGKNCIATFRDNRFAKDALYIMSRAQNLS